jgi:outer membrane lipoprotein-sorting protein
MFREIDMFKQNLVTFITILLALAAPLSAQSPTADEIVAKVDTLMNQPYVKATMKMTITTSSGNERTFVYETYSKDKGEKNLIKYISPSRVKGQATLMLNNADDIWAYFPRTDRVRKLATHAKKQKMEGSDFSYEDMGSGGSWINDFKASRLADEKIDGENCFVLELTKKPEIESGYSRQIIWVRQDNYCPVQVDYYDENDPENKLKRLSLQDIKDVEGIPTAMKMVMHNLQDDSETTAEYDSITYSVKLPDDLFTERGMKK